MDHQELTGHLLKLLKDQQIEPNALSVMIYISFEIQLPIKIKDILNSSNRFQTRLVFILIYNIWKNCGPQITANA